MNPITKESAMDIHINEFDELGVFTIRRYKTGEIVHTLKGKIVTTPTRTSIEIGKGKHIESSIGQFVNHSYMPNVKIVECNIVAIKDIAIHEEIKFDYTSTETRIVCPFLCKQTNRIVGSFSNMINTGVPEEYNRNAGTKSAGYISE